MILVVGGTGTLGRLTIEKLCAQKETVRVLTRNPENAQSLAKPGVEIVQGDLRDSESLAQACRGVNTVFAAAHSIMGRGVEASKYVDDQGHRWLIDAAKSAGVRHFVYVSAVGAAPNHPSTFFRIKYKIEQYLQLSDLLFTILRPTAFMESHAYELIGKPILETGKVTLFGKGENPRNFVAAADVAELAVNLLVKREGKGEMVEIGGPENLTNMEVVRMYERVRQQKAKVVHVPLGLLRVMSPLLRPVHPGLSQIMQASIAFDTSDQTFDPSDLLQHCPMTLRRLADWIPEYVSADPLPAVKY